MHRFSYAILTQRHSILDTHCSVKRLPTSPLFTGEVSWWYLRYLPNTIHRHGCGGRGIMGVYTPFSNVCAVSRLVGSFQVSTTVNMYNIMRAHIYYLNQPRLCSCLCFHLNRCDNSDKLMRRTM